MSRVEVAGASRPLTLKPAARAAGAAQQDRAWWVLLGASICIFCGQPAVAFYTFGVFLPEIIADTHWSRAGVAAALGPGALVAAAISPFVGTLCDRLGVRLIAIFGGPLFAIGFAVLGLAPTGAGTFTAAVMVMWLFVFAGSPVPYAQLLTGWFDKRRGMAISTMFACGALGIAVWPPYGAYLIAHLGWRHAYVAMGATAGAVICFTGLLLIRNPPVSVASAAGPVGAPGLVLGEAVKTARFWKTAATFLLLTAVLAGMAVAFPVILRQAGADAQTAASIMRVIGVAMFFGRLSLGLTLDRWFSPYVTVGITAVSMLAFVLLIASPGIGMLFAAAAFLGFGLGSEYAVVAYIVSRAFGFRAFGVIYGLITLATSIGAAVGPAAINVALVSSVSVRTISSVGIALLVVAIAILLTFQRAELPFGAAAGSKLKAEA